MERPVQAPTEEMAVLAETQILLVNKGGKTGVIVNSSTELFFSLGLLEMAKDSLKQQATQPPPSPLVVARQNPPLKLR